MAFNFGNWLEEAWANVNPFDNGATAKTVVAARKRKAAPAVTPAQTSSPTRIGGSNQLASPKAVQLTMPKTPTISTTKLMNKDEIMAFNFGNRKKNLAEIDAIQKKAQADIWNPAKIAGDIGKSVGQVASGAAKGVVDAGTGMINDYGKRVADTGEAAATVIRQLNGENQAFDKHMQDLATNANQTDINVLKRLQTESDPMKRKQLQKVLSLDARGTAINSMQNAQQQQLQATDPRKTLVNAGNTALDVLTLGKGKAILDGVRVTQKVTAPVLGQLAKNTALSFLQGAGIGAAYGGVNTAIDPNASPLDYARNMGQGAAMGAAVGLGAQVVFPVAGVAAKQAVKGTESAIVRSANYGLKPPTNLSKDELYVASKVRQAREGYISPQDITVQEAAIYQNVQRKLGAKPGTPDGEMAVVHALGAHRNFDTQRTLRKDATLNALEKSSDFTRQHLVPGGTLMGVKAKGFKDAKAKGLVFDGVDGKPRFEVDDSGATAKTIDKAYKYGKPQKLADLIDHPQLFENYPDLARTEVSFMKNVPEKFHADYNPQTGTINLNDKFIGADGKLNPKGVAALLHETQHGIQAKERFAMGADLDGGNKAYWNSAGEAEARAVQARMDMPMSERYVKDGADLYHGTTDEAFKLDKKKPLFLTGDKDNAGTYGKPQKFGAKDGKTLDLNDNATRDKYVREALGQDKSLEKYYKQIPENVRNDYFDFLEWELAQVKSGKMSMDDTKLLEKAFKDYKPITRKDVYANWDKVIAKAKKDGYDYIKHETEDPSAYFTFPETVALNPEKTLVKGGIKPRSTFYDSLDVPKKDLIIRNGGGKAMSIEPKDPLAQLKQEALKYKSAEEFVKAQGEPLYHGTKSDFIQFDNAKMGSQTDSGMYGKGFYLTPNQKSAKHYAGDKGYIKEVYADMKNPYVINTQADIPDIKVPNKTLEDVRNGTENYSRAFTKYLKDRGYDGVIDNLGVADNQRVVFDASQLKTRQQLTDLYNQAHTEAKTAAPKVEAPKGAPIEKTNVLRDVPIADFKKTDITSWNEAVQNVSKGKFSKTNGPAEVVLTNNGYKLVEGNHRAVQALNKGDATIKAKVISKEGLDEIAKRDGPHIKMGMQDAYTQKQLDAHFSKSGAPIEKTPQVGKPDPTAALKQEALKYKSAEEFVKNADYTPQTTRVYIKSKFRDGGGYADVPVIRKEKNITLYQGGTGEDRQFWTPNKNYAAQFGNVQKKIGTFYQVDNGNRMTDVYVDADKQLTDLYNQAHAEATPTPKQPTPFEQDLQAAGIKPTPKVEAPQATAAPVQKPNIDPNRNSSQRSGRQNPLPDNKARTGRTYPDDTPDIDTAQYVKDMGRSQKSAMQSESGFKAKFADFKEKFIDDLSPIEDRLNKAIKDGASVDVKDHITYQLDRSRRAEGVMNAYVRDNGLDKIIQNVDNVDEFDQYLIARHAKELDPEITTGRDIAKDAALVRQLEGKYGEKAKELYAYNQKLLDTSVDYGLISKESAAALKKQYPDYVPFNRIFNEDELANLYGGAGKGDASLSSQNVVKKIKGSNRAIASPLNSIIDKTRVVVEQGERNRAAQMLANYRELPGNPYNLKEIPKNETIGTRHTISYLDKGVKRTFETDKVIADAAKNMTRQEIGLWGRIAAVPARVLRGGATTVNIGFAGANVVKDVIGAAINSKHPFRIADPKAFGKALSAALEHDGPYYQELMREGVAGTSFDMYRNPLKSNIGEIRSHKNLGTRAAYNVTHPSQWYRTLENTIGRSEDFGRALQYYSNKSGFEAKLGKGSKDAKTLAADQARHNSTNFFRHGSAGKGINLAIPYWNAGVQGARIQTRRIAERPVQTVAKIGFAIAAPSAMIAMNNYSTPERQEIMDNIQDYEKEGNIIILGANPHMNQETGKWEDVYKIPVPPQHIGIHTAVQDAVRSAKTGEGFDVLKNLGKITQNYTTVNPTNLRETASSYTPQALKLVAEPMTNTNFFTGNKIVPESQKNLPAKDQFGDYTSGTAKILGGITNISPRQIDNAIRTGTGGAGQNALWASDKMLAGTGAIEAKDVKGQDPLTSITRRFSGAASVSASDKAENLFKKYKEQVVQSNEYKNASQYDKQRMLNRLQNDLSAVEWDKTGKSEKNLTGKQKALKSDGFDPSVYTNLDAGSSDILSKYNNMSSDERENWFAKNNDAEYKYYKAKYENDKANGEISKIEDIRRQKMLKKDEVGAKYTKDTRDLYSLSKAEVSDYLSSAKNGNQLAKELIAYDEALYNAGLVKYKKFRYGFASSSGGGRSRGGRKSSRNGAKKFSYSLSEFAPKKGTSKNKQLYDLLKEARKKYA